MDVMIMMPLASMFMDTFSITSTQFAYLLASYSVAAFLASMVGVFFLDRFQRKSTLLLVLGGLTIGTALCSLAQGYIPLLIVRFITGLFGGIIGALALSIISDIYKFEERGKAMGFLMAAFSAAAALGVPLGFYGATQYGWQLPFVAISIFGALLWILILIKFPKIPIHERAKNIKPLEALGKLLSDKNVLLALLLGVILVLGHFMIIPFITPYMMGNVGFAENDITLMYLVGGILTIVSAPFIGKLTDSFGVTKVFILTMVLSFIPILFMTHMGARPLWQALIATSGFFIFGSGRMIPPQSLITGAVGPELRGSFMSLKSALQQLGIGLSSVVGGWIVFENEAKQIFNYEYVGYLSIFICILALLIAPKIRVAEGN